MLFRSPVDFQWLKVKKVKKLKLKNKDHQAFLRSLIKAMECDKMVANGNQDDYDLLRKSYFDRGRKSRSFRVGEKVIVSIADRYVGNSSKLARLYDGPFKVLSVINGVTYKLERINKNSKQEDIMVVHVSKIKRYYEGKEEIILEEKLLES